MLPARPQWLAAPILRKLLRQADFIEGTFEARAFGRAAHDADVQGGLQRQVAQPRRSEILAIERIQDFKRRPFAHDAPPQWVLRGDASDRGPIRKLAGDHNAGVANTVNEFEAALQPIAGVDPHH